MARKFSLLWRLGNHNSVVDTTMTTSSIESAEGAKAEGAGAPEEDQIQITSGMIEAGCDEYELFDSRDRASWVVTAVYRAMEKARLSKAGPK